MAGTINDSSKHDISALVPCKLSLTRFLMLLILSIKLFQTVIEIDWKKLHIYSYRSTFKYIYTHSSLNNILLT